MSKQDIALMAHLMRRAGFSATRGELEEYIALGYEAKVEDLLYPSDPGNMPDDVYRRISQSHDEGASSAGADWMRRMITTRCPLEDKVALFLHGLFAVGYSKGNQARAQADEIDMFRDFGLGSFRDLLIQLSMDPAMIFWLDNNDNHNGAINENFGRELLELFAMGLGNYSEDDIKECARAFTGWTLGNLPYMSVRATKDSFSPYGRIAWHFEYKADDHDDGEKTFLGETGRFNGEDIVDIVVKQPATARFICTRLFQYFAADEVDEEGGQVVEAMVKTYFDSDYEIRSVLRTLFNSEHFKSERARLARVKTPVELVIGAIRLAGSYREPTLAIEGVSQQTVFMGQAMLNPPSVEGWHEGKEWIGSGSLMQRINFVAKELRNVELQGVRDIIERLATDSGGVLSAEEVVERCMDLMGPVEASEATRASLTEHVARKGELDLRDREQGDESEQRVGDVLSLIAATREFQLA